MTESTMSKYSCTHQNLLLERRVDQQLFTPMEVVALVARRTCTKASLPIWPSTPGLLCSMLTTGSHQRPGAPIMCSTFMRRSSMCQPTQLTLVLTLQGLPWQARVEEATFALLQWSSLP